MSAPLKLTSADLNSLGCFLASISQATREHGVTLGPYSRTDVEIQGNTLAVAWDAERCEYVVDDRNGS